MKQILINKTQKVLKELIDYLDGNKSDNEKNFIIGELTVLVELINEIKEDR